MKKLEETFLSQYANTPEITEREKGFNQLVDPANDIEKFRKEVFDPRTATTWGLDVWGEIVQIGREIEVEASDQFFGFEYSNLQPFNCGTFYAPGLTQIYRLGNDAFRQLIFLKGMSNISDCSIPSLNNLLSEFFKDRGRAYIKEVGIMKIAYIFEFWLQPWERSLMRRYDIPPKPAGVGFVWMEVPPKETFGFAGSGLRGFNQGVFNGGYYDALR